MKYFRISSRGQDLQGRYSADAITWVTAFQQVVNFDLTYITPTLQSAPWDNNIAPYSSKFSEIKIAPISGVRLYANLSGDLASYLNLTIERGTGAAGGAGHSCTGFTPTATVYTGTLAGLPTTYTTGLDEWHPSNSPETVSYRISTATNNDQTQKGKTAQSTFTWQAQAGA